MVMTSVKPKVGRESSILLYTDLDASEDSFWVAQLVDSRDQGA
jgi:hypothetical protein